MPYVDPQSVHNPTTGQVATAAWGDAVRDALQYLSGGFPHCSILESTAQALTTGTWTALTSNEENSDIGGMHSTSSNTSRVTVPAGEGGLYGMSAAIEHAANATGERFCGVGKNGASPTYSLAGYAAAPTSGTSQSGFMSLVLAAGDYVECMGFQTRGANNNCNLRDFTVRWIATS